MKTRPYQLEAIEGIRKENYEKIQKKDVRQSGQ